MDAEKEGSIQWESHSSRHTRGQGYEMKAHIMMPTINSQQMMSFYSVRPYREVEMFEPRLGPRVCRLGTGITKEKEPRMQSMLRTWKYHSSKN